jgi:hypothetical protein
VPIDSSGWVDLASTGCGIEGAWWWAKDDRGTTLDGAVVDQAPFVAARGMCIKGSTVLDPTYAAWGAIIGLDLAGNRAAGWDATARGVVGFDVEIAGSSGGAALRIELESVTGRTTSPPFVATQPGTHVVLIDRAVVPLAWDAPNRGEKAVASNLRKLQLHVVGGEGVSAFDVCIERITPIVSVCADFARVDAGGYVLNNNPWGKEAITGFSQCVFAASSSNRYGWLWRWPASNPSGQVRAYPELMAGRSPWPPVNTGHGLPAPISSNISLTFNLDLEAEPTGTYNFAPEVWLTSAAVPSTTNITHELMFWFARNNMTPAGSRTGSVTIGGVSYDVYINENHDPGAGAGTATGWTYVAFVAATPVISGTIELKPFLDHLAATGRLTGAAYYAVVDFGTELVSGSGSVIVSNFSVAVRP